MRREKMSGSGSREEETANQLKNCQKELQILKEKLVVDEIWKKTVETFLMSHLGFDVQRAMKEPSSLLACQNVGIAFDKSPTLGDLVGGRYQNRKNSSTTSTNSLGIISSNIHISNSNKMSNLKSDVSASISNYSSSHLFSSLDLASQMGSKNKSLHRLNNKIFPTPTSSAPRSKYSSSYSPSIDQDAGMSGFIQTGKRKLSDDLVLWSNTPTFPLSDITPCAENLTGDSSPTDNDQDTESDIRPDTMDFSEVKFQEIEDKIREVVLPGTRKSVYECLICGKSLTQRQNARLHIRRVHLLERLKCTGCGRGFYDRRCITNHKAICAKYAEWSKNKDFRPSSLSNPIPIDSAYTNNQMRSSSSLSDSENEQDTSAGNSWMEKSRASPPESESEMTKNENSRHPVTFIINNNDDDNLAMRKETLQSGEQSTTPSKDEGDLDPGDGSSSDLFYAPGKLVVVEIVPEMFHFDDPNN